MPAPLPAEFAPALWHLFSPLSRPPSAPCSASYMVARIRRLFNRAVLDQNEVNIMRGILTSVQGKRRRAGEPHAPRDEGRS